MSVVADAGPRPKLDLWAGVELQLWRKRLGFLTAPFAMVSANWMTRIPFLQIGNAATEREDEVRKANNPNWFEPWRIFWMRRLAVTRCRRCDGFVRVPDRWPKSLNNRDFKSAAPPSA